MQYAERSRVGRLGRTALMIIGIAGGFAAFDAAFLFVFLLLAALVVAPPGPYSGLVIVFVLPVVAIVGAVVAWTSYLALHDEEAVEDEDPHVRT
jgi:hypothetical protein